VVHVVAPGDELEIVGIDGAVLHQRVEVHDLAPIVGAVEHDLHRLPHLARLHQRRHLEQLGV